jgi:flagellar basal-body rod protein FlgB
MTDGIFGLSEKALQLSEDRAVILTNNIVNSATPHYKAKDIDFYKLLQEEKENASAANTTAGTVSKPQLLYRVPMQMSQDGNTVDEEIERKNFIENAMHYQVSLTFIQNKTNELEKAFKGE